MKRALVEYSASSESESEPEQVSLPAKKRRKLPPLSSSLTPSTPRDDPSKHQGRVRTQPFVEGQFATHIYAVISASSIQDIIHAVIKEVRASCRELEVFSSLEAPKVNRDSDKDSDTEQRRSILEELHISLSRPLFLRSHQRDPVVRSVKDITKRTTRFPASFASFSVLNNDEGTRSFLALEIGAGHAEFSNISTTLVPLLMELRQPAYYSSPRYHVSIAWILTTTLDAPRFPKDLTATLEENHGGTLRERTLDINEICTKIGKSITRCKLASLV